MKVSSLEKMFYKAKCSTPDVSGFLREVNIYRHAPDDYIPFANGKTCTDGFVTSSIYNYHEKVLAKGNKGGGGANIMPLINSYLVSAYL